MLSSRTGGAGDPAQGWIWDAVLPVFDELRHIGLRTSENLSAVSTPTP
jgi:hypothetical protein